MEARGPGAGKEKRERGSEREKEREVSPKFYIVISEVIFDMQSDVYTYISYCRCSNLAFGCGTV